MGDDVTLVSSAEETAKDVYRVLTATGRLRDADAPAPRHRFAATGDPEPFRRLGRRFLGPEIDRVQPAGSPADAADRIPTAGAGGSHRPVADLGSRAQDRTVPACG
jgi:hypothetical protein